MGSDPDWSVVAGLSRSRKSRLVESGRIATLGSSQPTRESPDRARSKRSSATALFERTTRGVHLDRGRHRARTGRFATHARAGAVRSRWWPLAGRRRWPARCGSRRARSSARTCCRTCCCGLRDRPSRDPGRARRDQRGREFARTRGRHRACAWFARTQSRAGGPAPGRPTDRACIATRGYVAARRRADPATNLLTPRVGGV